MITKADINAYRAAFVDNAGSDAPMGKTTRFYLTLWTIFFALATLGGLLA